MVQVGEKPQGFILKDGTKRRRQFKNEKTATIAKKKAWVRATESDRTKMTDMNPQYFPMAVKFKQVFISTTCNDYSASAKLTVQNLLLRNIS